MDSFSIIQNFFTRMVCNSCHQQLSPDGIELIREDEGVFIVSVRCHACDRQIGVAMVGLEPVIEMQRAGLGMRKPDPRFPDPELTPEEIERLETFAPISHDDVLDAHHFFQSLGDDWQRLIPPEIRERCTTPETE